MGMPNLCDSLVIVWSEMAEEEKFRIPVLLKAFETANYKNSTQFVS